MRFSTNLNFADLGVGLEISETKAKESCGTSSSARVLKMELCGTLFIEISNWRESGPKSSSQPKKYGKLTFSVIEISGTSAFRSSD